MGNSSAQYIIPGKDNILADRESRIKNNDTEWKLNPKIFHQITSIGAIPSIDLFASRINYQIKPFVSWREDPEAIAVC